MCSMAGKRILIIEDDSVLRNLYVTKFRADGFEVSTADDGLDGIEKINAAKPDLVICDIRMPKADGFEVLRTFPKPPRAFQIILLTNFDQVDYRENASKMGAEGYFVKKDMTLGTLIGAVKKLLKE